MRPSGARLLLFRAAAAAISLTIAIACGELVLRILYRDRGTTTVGGPGGREFQYLFADPAGVVRGPAATGPKAPGVRRILVQGDSITWGVGVRDWRDTYPTRLLDQINAPEPRFDMAVMATPGRNTGQHADVLASVSGTLDPDLVIYQWYVNDLEVGVERPRFGGFWRSAPFHQALTARSFLYYFLDAQVGTRVLGAGRAYQAWIRRTFREGTEEWALFRTAFHRWAVLATTAPRRALVFLYPQVPFRGPNPLAELHRRMQDLAGPTRLVYPAAMLAREVGENTSDASIDTGPVRRGVGLGGCLARFSNLPLAPGQYTLALRARLDQAAAGRVARVRVTEGERVLGERRIEAADLEPVGRWTMVSVPFTVEASGPVEIGWAVDVSAGARVSLDSFSLPVRYPHLEVWDLADRLNRYDTHASIFDSHPNARTHEVLADLLAPWVTARAREMH